MWLTSAVIGLHWTWTGGDPAPISFSQHRLVVDPLLDDGVDHVDVGVGVPDLTAAEVANHPGDRSGEVAQVPERNGYDLSPFTPGASVTLSKPHPSTISTTPSLVNLAGQSARKLFHQPHEDIPGRVSHLLAGEMRGAPAVLVLHH